MTTYLRAPEAARRLGVSTATLYSYVSRKRIARTLGADGRTSLFDLADIDSLLERNRRSTPPPPTIDVRISTAITQLDEEGLRFRDHPVDGLVDQPFESVAELLWTGTLPENPPRWKAPTRPEAVDRSVMGMVRLASALPPTEFEDAPAVARRFISSLPQAFGGPAAPNRSIADRLTRAWVPRPDPRLVRAVNRALVSLADHELATSTLAVRVAASVRASPIAAIIAGLATVEGDLHGSASLYAHELFVQAEQRGAEVVLEGHRAERRRVPGFGHKIYKGRDPRLDPLLASIRDLPDPHGRLRIVDEVLYVSGTLVARHPNIDLALGALTYVAGFPPDAPLFAIARVAGWAAHYLEEVDERPVRFRGLAR